jgi:hypothetical protein
MMMVAAVLALQAAAPANPDLLYKKEHGFSIMKPPKNEEWGFTDQGFFSNSQACVSHKVDVLMIDIYCQEKAAGMSYYDPKAAADSAFKNISGFAGVTDVQRQPSKPTKLPGGAAGGVNAHIVDMTFKREGQAKELKMWNFVGKENQNFYSITLVGDEGMYKKHQKHVDFIISTLKIWKIPK